MLAKFADVDAMASSTIERGDDEAIMIKSQRRSDRGFFPEALCSAKRDSRTSGL